jgi:predicted glycogen debranching enzyme
VSTPLTERAEWLEADGLGGFASGTATGVRTRRYHALLLVAAEPPGGRVLLVNGVETWVETSHGAFALCSHRYRPDVVHPDGAQRTEHFTTEPWPRWVVRLADGTRIEHELFVRPGAPAIFLAWRVVGDATGVRLFLRPLLSGRDPHALHHENPAFRFAAQTGERSVVWRPYDGLPAITAVSNGAYREEPLWYRSFQYDEERARGLDFVEDLAAPGVFTFDLAAGEAHLVLSAGDDVPAHALASVRDEEAGRRRGFRTRLHRSADAYLVRRGGGRTIIAGYPWFGDWGRDTFIALRGLCLATGRTDEARDILLEWAGMVSEGMLPNRFPDHGEAPEYNSVDAALWFVVAVHELLQAGRVSPREQGRLVGAIEAILAGYVAGTRYGIRLDGDGLLAAGVPGVQLTWMDAKVGDWVVTPRIGKPVEVQALWLNALHIAGAFSERWAGILARGRASFAARFWNEASGSLHDVVDPDHRAGEVDASFRPNQIFAVGGLPMALLDGERARRVVDTVQARLLTPLGLRSLAPGEPGYTPRYAGGVRERDGAYHQGTVWPWLMGGFVEAWVRVRGGTAAARAEARTRFLDPLLLHLGDAGLGHLPEVADAEPPHRAGGCPFQAWSVGEALRLSEVVLRGPA